MDVATFRRLCEIAYVKAGITLGENKEALVAARVGKRMRALELTSEKEYLTILEKAIDGEEIIQFLDVISTNHTTFFREEDHFQLLSQLLNQWRHDGVRRLRFWSAASSTGEEPYSIAFIATMALSGSDIDWRILATDISTRVLRQAEKGIFPSNRAETVDAKNRRVLFEKGPTENTVQVRQAIREKVTFRRLNLATPPYPMKGPFDIIFCRNVMIYFDLAVRQRVVSGMEPLIRSGGYFLTGHAEALSGIRSGLHMVKPSVFRRMNIYEGSHP